MRESIPEVRVSHTKGLVTHNVGGRLTSEERSERVGVWGWRKLVCREALSNGGIYRQEVTNAVFNQCSAVARGQVWQTTFGTQILGILFVNSGVDTPRRMALQ